jgi:hypothetical protein
LPKSKLPPPRWCPRRRSAPGDSRCAGPTAPWFLCRPRAPRSAVRPRPSRSVRLRTSRCRPTGRPGGQRRIVRRTARNRNRSRRPDHRRENTAPRRWRRCAWPRCRQRPPRRSLPRPRPRGLRGCPRPPRHWRVRRHLLSAPRRRRRLPGRADRTASPARVATGASTSLPGFRPGRRSRRTPSTESRSTSR